MKVLDLGLVRHVETGGAAQFTALTQAGTVIGTVDYLAPEQARDSANVDGRADLYALGCTLFYLLTARPPFLGGTAVEKVMKHQFDLPPPALESMHPTYRPRSRG